ncbi:hypothetical protein LXL04_017981 [Taraxacum kok-saghyz]
MKKRRRVKTEELAGICEEVNARNIIFSTISIGANPRSHAHTSNLLSRLSLATKKNHQAQPSPSCCCSGDLEPSGDLRGLPLATFSTYLVFLQLLNTLGKCLSRFSSFSAAFLLFSGHPVPLSGELSHHRSPFLWFPEHLSLCHLELWFESYDIFSTAVQKLYIPLLFDHIAKFITLKRFGV